MTRHAPSFGRLLFRSSLGRSKVRTSKPAVEISLCNARSMDRSSSTTMTIDLCWMTPLTMVCFSASQSDERLQRFTLHSYLLLEQEIGVLYLPSIPKRASVPRDLSSAMFIFLNTTRYGTLVGSTHHPRRAALVGASLGAPRSARLVAAKSI